jgi:hypothetical protein
MAMAENSDEFDGLDAVFAAARAKAPEPSAALLARVEADALRVMAERQAAVAVVPRRPARRGFWAIFSEVLGGRGAVAGLATATLAGLWLGFSPPQGLATLTQSVTQSVLGSSTSLDGLDLIPTLDTVLTTQG